MLTEKKSTVMPCLSRKNKNMITAKLSFQKIFHSDPFLMQNRHNPGKCKRLII